MSDAQSFAAQIVLADYAVADPIGKVNLLGGSLGLIGFNTATGLSAPFALWVQLRRRDDGSSVEVAVEVILKDAGGNPVLSANVSGELQAVRIAQNLTFRPTVVPGFAVPIGAVDSTANMVFNFSNGVPLRLGEAYRWSVAIDTEEVASVGFFVPGPPTVPVLG